MIQKKSNQFIWIIYKYIKYERDKIKEYILKFSLILEVHLPIQ